MAAVRKIDEAEFVGVEPRHLDEVGARLVDLSGELALEPDRVEEPQLGPLWVLAVAVDGVRLLLRDFDHDPEPRTLVATTASDDAARRALAQLGLPPRARSPSEPVDD